MKPLPMLIPGKPIGCLMFFQNFIGYLGLYHNFLRHQPTIANELWKRSALTKIEHVLCAVSEKVKNGLKN